jgi:hypothetical protein
MFYIIETEKVLGGDSQYFYVGTYSLQGSKAVAKVKITHYTGTTYSIFGALDEFDLELSGTPAHGGFTMNGYIVQNRALQISMRLTRRAELP